MHSAVTTIAKNTSQVSQNHASIDKSDGGMRVLLIELLEIDVQIRICKNIALIKSTKGGANVWALLWALSF